MLDIWMVSSEWSPLAQTGGLADVVRALPRALAARGHRVRVFLPAYGRIDRRSFAYDLAEDHLAVPLGWSHVPVRFLSRPEPDGVRLTLVQSEEMFGRDGFYGPPGGDYDDNARRFALLSRAVTTLAAKVARPPDILHGHDWHAGLLPLFARFSTPWPGRRPGTVHTIHNMGYQGRFGASEIDWVAPPGPVRDAVFNRFGIEAGGDINFLQAGLRYADRLTAVSPRYAWEISTPEGGFGLHEVAGYRRSDLTGILNGADYDRWDPSRDRQIAQHYDAATVDRKEECRRSLRAAFGLGPRGSQPAPQPPLRPRAAAGAGPSGGGRPALKKTAGSSRKTTVGTRAAKPRAARRRTAAPPEAASPETTVDAPVLGVVSRLVHQKGIDVLLEAAPALLEAGAELVVLGAGDDAIVRGLEGLRARHPDRVGLYIGFNEALSHQVVAGSDMLLVPSRYEPCGLVQMHAMRYGTIPLVHRTGGLADTVRDADEHPGQGTGFVFDRIDAGSLVFAAGRATLLRRRDPAAWRALQLRAMAEDFSWDRSAAAYERVYASIVI
jgi:starch synthase